MRSLRRIFVLFTVVLYLSSSTSSFEIVASAPTRARAGIILALAILRMMSERNQRSL